MSCAKRIFLISPISSVKLLVTGVLLLILTVLVNEVMKEIAIHLNNNDFIEESHFDLKNLNHLENRIEMAGLFERNIQNVTLRRRTLKIQNEVHKKIYKLFDEMQNNSLQNELKNFYLHGSDRKYAIVLSKWRSGSSFFGDFMQSVPGSFYSYEPLINKHEVFHENHLSFGLKRITNFLQCNYSNAPDYFQFISRHPHGFRMVKALHEDTVNNMDVVFDEEYVSALCNIYPFQSMKILKLELRQMKSFFDNNFLNAKVVLLVS